MCFIKQSKDKCYYSNTSTMRATRLYQYTGTSGLPPEECWTVRFFIMHRIGSTVQGADTRHRVTEIVARVLAVQWCSGLEIAQDDPHSPTQIGDENGA